MHFGKGCTLLCTVVSMTCTVQSLEAYNDCMYILNASSIFKSIKFNMRIISPLFKLVLNIYSIITTLCTFLFQKSLFSVLVREFPALYVNPYIVALWRGLATEQYPKQRRSIPNKYTIHPQIRLTITLSSTRKFSKRYINFIT